ncbi:MAG: helix-hairpin-helix domain-containing protein [Planctomycetota bacterium]
MTSSRRHRRHGFVIITVFVVVGSLLLITMSLISQAQLNLTATRQAEITAQQHTLARSAIKLLLHEFDRQRDDILDALLPEIDEEYTIYEVGRTTGIVRLRTVGAERRRFIPTSSRLDINLVTQEMLEATGVVEPDVARRIVSFRTARGTPFTSLSDLLEIDGVTASMVFGEPRAELDDDSGVAATFDDAAQALADVVDVYCVEPALQQNGRLRINLNTPWSDELGSRLDERFGDGTGQIVKEIMDNGTTFESDGRIIQVMRFFDLDPDEWVEPVDALTTASDSTLYGRVNLNDAPIEVLRALPGIDDEAAAAIVDERESLTEEEQNTIVWPCLREIVPAEAFDELGGMLTTRCWAYRIQFEVGEIDRESPTEELERPLRFEAVIDLASPRARLASLREITALEVARAVAPAEVLDEINDLDDTDVDAEGMIGAEPVDVPPVSETRTSDFAVPLDFGPPGAGSDDMPSDDAEAESSAGGPSGTRMGRWRRTGSTSGS